MPASAAPARWAVEPRPEVRCVREHPCSWLGCALLSLVENLTFWRIPRAPKLVQRKAWHLGLGERRHRSLCTCGEPAPRPATPAVFDDAGVGCSRSLDPPPPPHVVQSKAEAKAVAESTAKKLNEWQQRKDEYAGKAQYATDKAATAGKVKLAATLLGKLWFVPGAGTLAGAIGGVAALTQSDQECQACCFKFMGALAGYAGPFQKWADLGHDVPGFIIFKEANRLVDEYLHNDGFASLETADKKLGADAWTLNFRLLQLDLVTAIQQVPSMCVCVSSNPFCVCDCWGWGDAVGEDGGCFTCRANAWFTRAAS